MDGKNYIKNKAFCPLPWTGFIYEPTGNIKNCIVSNDSIGDLKKENLENILNGNKNNEIKNSMLRDVKHSNCNACYNLENNKKSFEIISSRIYYLKELKQVDTTIYSNTNNFLLSHIDARWSNTCNFACVYCSSEYSSKWEHELKKEIVKPTAEQKTNLKNYIFENVKNLKNVYLAGGEPLLMKENEEFLKLLLEKNPDITIRVNTNLSKTQTNVFNLLTHFKNVHWIVSVESIEDEFEYIRYGGKWIDFIENLNIISKLNHKISFNMLWFLLNFKSLFSTIDYFKKIGFHNNSFVIGPLLKPMYLNINNLPEYIKHDLGKILKERINEKPGYLLEDGYKNLLIHINEKFDSNLFKSISKIKKLEQRRNTNLISTFPELHSILQKEGHYYG